MPYVAVPDKNAGDPFTQAMWATYVEGNLNAGVDRPLADIPLSVAAATIDFTSIPTTHAQLLLVVLARSDAVTTTTTLLARLNNDSAANYAYQNLRSTATTASASTVASATSCQVGTIPGASETANRFAMFEILVPVYLGTAHHKLLRSSGGLYGAAGFIDTFLGQWSGGGPTAVNRITLLPGAGNFLAGSRVILYGLGAM